MKKKQLLIKALGYFLSAAMFITSIPVPIFATESEVKDVSVMEVTDEEGGACEEGAVSSNSISNNTAEAVEESEEKNVSAEYPIAGRLDLFELNLDTVDDDTLNHYLNMSDWYKVGLWLSALSEEDYEKLMERDTVLLQETMISEPGKEAKTMRYYEYAMEVYNAKKDYVYATPATASGYWTTKIVKVNSAGTALKTATITHKITGIDTTKVTSERQNVTLTKSITSNWCDVSFSDEVNEMSTYKANADDGTYPLAYSYFNFSKPAGYKVSVSYSITDSVHNLYWNPVQTFKTTESFLGSGGVLNSNIERKGYPTNITYNGVGTEQYLVSYYEGRHYLVSLINMYQNAGIGTTSNATNGNLVQTITLTPCTYNVNYNGNGSTSGSVAAQSCTYDQTYTAQQNGYTRAYTVTYNGNGGTPAVASQTATYSFAGWGKEQKTTVDYKAGASFGNLTDHNNGAVTLYAIWNSKSITLPSATRTGYTLSKWDIGAAGASYTPTANVTATASWTANPYKITLNANGGSLSSTSLNATYDANITLPTPTRTGYTFTGWKATDGTVYSGSVKNLTSTKNGTVALTAQWTANGYTIAFKGNGVSDPSSIGATYGVATTLPALTRTGYTFGGWKSTSGTIYTTSATNLTSTKGATVTLTAVWTPCTYKVSLNANGGSASSTSLNATYDTDVSLPTPTRAGYTFGGWVGEGGTYKGVVKNLTATNGATVSLTASWTANTNTPYKIIYRYENGYATENYLDGNEYNRPSTSSLLEETKYGITDSTITVSAPDNIAGYDTPMAQTVKIAGDGSTVITFYYRAQKKKQDYQYKVNHYIKTSPDGEYKLFKEIKSSVKEDSVVTPPLDQDAIDAVNAVKGCYCKEPTTQTVTISKDGMIIGYYYDCIKSETASGSSSNSGSAGSESTGGLTQAQIDEITKRIAAGLSFSLEVKGAKYDIVQNKDGTLGIKFITAKDQTNVTIPDVVKIGEKVYRITEIQKNAFKNNKALEKVTLSANISKIGDSAFEGCTKLKTVIMNSGVVTIGKNAFKNCISLTKFKAPSTLQTIGDYAFYGCSKLTTVTLNTGLVKIGVKAFYKCKSLTKIKIPVTVLKIGGYAFAKCTKLKTVTFATDANLLAIGEGGFSETAITSIKLPDRLTKITKMTFYKCKKLKSVRIGIAVTHVGSSAFRYCSKLKTITGGEKLSIIYKNAFRDCTSLTKITIPSKVQVIGNTAFYNCKNLKTVTIKSKAITSVGSKAFKKCKKNIKFKVPKSKVKAYSKQLKGKY